MPEADRASETAIAQARRPAGRVAAWVFLVEWILLAGLMTWLVFGIQYGGYLIGSLPLLYGVVAVGIFAVLGHRWAYVGAVTVGLLFLLLTLPLLLDWLQRLDLWPIVLVLAIAAPSLAMGWAWLRHGFVRASRTSD